MSQVTSEPPPENGADAAPVDEVVDREREALLSVIAASKPDTVVHKVGWILNVYPETRNSDVTLQLRYWETFCPEYDSRSFTPDDLYKLPRLTSLARARAKVQNTLKLFLADAEVRKRRGTLSDEERDDAVTAKSSSAPMYAVYADESGKTQQYLLVGSLWILQGPETLRIAEKLLTWRETSEFKNELHFSDVDERSLRSYKQAVDIVLDNASALSLKYVAIPRAGAGPVQQVIPKLLYHLIVRGVAHEHETGRAPLPRSLYLMKDAEQPGYDELVLADLRDRLKTAAIHQFGGQLKITMLGRADSRGNDLIQIADVFTGSVNRLINQPIPAPRIPGPKDDLANYVITRTGITIGAEADELVDDLAVRLSI